MVRKETETTIKKIILPHFHNHSLERRNSNEKLFPDIVKANMGNSRYARYSIGNDLILYTVLDYYYEIVSSGDSGRFFYETQYYGYYVLNAWYKITENAYLHFDNYFASHGENIPDLKLYVFGESESDLVKNSEMALYDIIEKVHKYKQNVKLMKRNKNSIDRMFLPNSMKDEILEYFETFLNSRDVYKEIGITWKTGVLFYGAPGNGKTLCIRALCEYFGLELRDIKEDYNRETRKFELNDVDIEDYSRKIPIVEISNRIYNITNPIVYVLEDIEKTVSHQSFDDSPVVTTSELLNAIDGVNQVLDGTIFIGTTNNINDMSPAILGRPGRFDLVLEFVAPVLEQILDFFKYHNFNVINQKNDITETYAQRLIGTSMAFVEEFMKVCKSKSQSSNASKEVADKVLNKIQQHIKIANVYNKQTIGFK